MPGQYTSSILSILSDFEYALIQSKIPADVTGERRNVLLAALSLEGRVRYFWGGKSEYTGWDQRWGEMRMVTSGGTSMSGTDQPFGLDCSRFVSWVFIQAGGKQSRVAIHRQRYG